ncbi:hypothetical protein HanXRQr2_Chr03g0126141 [Helianthus annuus]|uniref:Uncharacterized protein n=1 Tax=Helianthus annuus TaxID=4232 RepID=A0A9K3JIV5_HELAN|nr:hypothetical protein HanXRQr2_Chr03g0126141 [Helianthus annuus]KAJ0602237.1 hypothetical protein HanIR_Chr03g0137401 [Helianthus annuus]KAJ0944977.1 hypothetical protein HanPSC8_Chr03g0122781 [Helianthus annuus]
MIMVRSTGGNSFLIKGRTYPCLCFNANIFPGHDIIYSRLYLSHVFYAFSYLGYRF